MSKTSKIAVRSAKKILGIESSEQNQWIRLLGVLIKIGLSAAAIFFIGYKLYTRQTDFQYSILKMEDVGFYQVLVSLVLPSVVLSALNWFIEVNKWRILLNSSFEVKWTTAFKAVLSGTTIGIFSPNRIGEFVGRVLALKPEQRISASLLSMVNGISQSLATYTFGVFGFIVLAELTLVDQLGFAAVKTLQITLLLSLAFITILFYRVRFLADWFMRFAWLRKYENYILIFQNVSDSILTKLYSWSLLRFLTFIVQYVVVFSFISNGISTVDVMIASVLTLFSSTLVSFIPIPDLLIRESLALSFFEIYSVDPIAVSAGVLLVWLINVALPAVLGTFSLFTYRIFKTR